MAEAQDGFSRQFYDLEEHGSINLRDEIEYMLTNHGYYIFLRRKKDQHCPNYDFTKRQCVKRACPHCNGTGFMYGDLKYKTYKIPGVNMEAGPRQEIWMPLGLIGPHRQVFFFEYDVNPILTDQILEVKLGDDGEPILAYTITRVYNIQYTHAFRERGGRIEYWAAVANEQIAGA